MLWNRNLQRNENSFEKSESSKIEGKHVGFDHARKSNHLWFELSGVSKSWELKKSGFHRWKIDLSFLP